MRSLGKQYVCCQSCFCSHRQHIVEPGIPPPPPPRVEVASSIPRSSKNIYVSPMYVSFCHNGCDNFGTFPTAPQHYARETGTDSALLMLEILYIYIIYGHTLPFRNENIAVGLVLSALLWFLNICWHIRAVLWLNSFCFCSFKLEII